MANYFEHIDSSLSGNPALEDLFYLLRDYAGFGRINDEITTHRKRYEQREKAFHASLSVAQHNLYEDLYEELCEELSIQAKQAFIYGYKVALKLLHSD